ncbi:MAG: hypothetical protein OJF47_004072 [Nitrospira sp.]|nr:MAG: hypothetical protein OJF47_004072 [Nitrospira sp.]
MKYSSNFARCAMGENDRSWKKILYVFEPCRSLFLFPM